MGGHRQSVRAFARPQAPFAGAAALGSIDARPHLPPLGPLPPFVRAPGLTTVFYTARDTQSRRQLVVILGGVALFYLAPMLLIGPPAYPHPQYRSALLTVAVSSIIGLATQRLVGTARFQAGEARRRE